MSMRQLSDIEKRLNKRAIARLKLRSNNIKSYYLPKTKLELGTGLEISIEKTKKELDSAIEEWENELEQNIQQIDILQKQNKEGVPEKVNTAVG